MDQLDSFLDAKSSGDSLDSFLDSGRAQPQQAPESNPSYEVAGHSTTAQGTQMPYLANAMAGAPAINPTKALLTNEPVGAADSFIRALPSNVGGLIGGFAGSPAGPLGAIGGAGLGGASFEAARQGAVNVYGALNGGRLTPPSAVLGNVGLQGAVNAAGEGGGQIASAAFRVLPKVGAAVMRNAAAIPEKSGQAALEDLSLLGRAPTDEAVSKAYQDFHAASGTVSRKESIAASADPFDTVSRAMNDMREAAQKLKDGTLTTQEAVNASQAGRLIRDQKMRGNELAREVGEAANDLKGQFDDFIQNGATAGPKSNFTYVGGQKIPYNYPEIKTPAYPEYQAARQAAWENAVASDFSHAFPQNLNGSSNQLRGYGSLAGAITGVAAGLATGHPLLAAGAAISPILQSPLAYGYAIRGANAVAPLAQAAAQDVRFAPGSIAAYYNSPRTAP